jgi:hypothetical protein
LVSAALTDDTSTPAAAPSGERSPQDLVYGLRSALGKDRARAVHALAMAAS